MSKNRTYTEWQYEFVSATESGNVWITEDDEHTARTKAKDKNLVTGRVRSREVTVKTTKWIVEELT